VIGQAIFRVIGLALLLGSWFWIVPLAVDVANGMSGYVLSDDAVGSALRRSFGGEALLQLRFPLLALLTAIMLAFAILALVVLKFIIAIAFAALYIGGPALIGFAALPRVGNLPLAIATRGLLTLTIIPLLWTVVFAAWAGVSAGMFDTATGDGGGAIGALMGPGLFLAGLVVMLAVTKKVLAMATLGVGLSVPGATIARSAITTAVTRGLGAAKGTAAAGAATRGGERTSPAPSRPPGGAQPQTEPATVRSGQRAPTPGRPLRKLEVDDPSGAQRKREGAAAKRAAGASISLFGATEQGVFDQPRHVPGDEWTSVSRRVAERQRIGEPSVEEAREAAYTVPKVDRSAFGVLAKESLEHPPERARDIYKTNAARIVASRAQQVTPEQLDAGITLAAARPDVVNTALAPDYKSWGHGREDEAPATGTYDSDLMDQQGGLERYRQRFEGKRDARERSQGDLDLPF
jgi:hypothetical protein